MLESLIRGGWRQEGMALTRFARTIADAQALPRIVYTLGTLGIGGTELRSLDVFRVLKQRYPALSILVYVTSGESGPLRAEFEALGIEIVYGKGGWRGFMHFRATCRRARATLVHSNHGLASGLHALAAATLGVKVRYSHLRALGDDWTGPRGWLKRAAGRILLRAFSTKVIGVADAVRAYARIPASQWLTLYEGVVGDAPSARRTRTPGNPLVVTLLGRISPEKNYLRALATVAALRSMGVDARLRFVGPATVKDRERLTTAIAQLAEPGWALWEGPSRAPLSVVANSDVLLIPSLREGLPGAVLEAISVGTPVVGARLPGMREIAAQIEGVTLVDLAEDDMRWAEAIVQAAERADAAALAESFARSPFQFDRHVDGYSRLWGLPG